VSSPELGKHGAPGWITSLGALAALALGALNFASGSNDKHHEEHEKLRAEIKADARRDVDLACACCRAQGGSGVR